MKYAHKSMYEPYSENMWALKNVFGGTQVLGLVDKYFKSGFINIFKAIKEAMFKE